MSLKPQGDYGTLVRYLLGELPEIELELVEERQQIDAEFEDLCDEVEADLVNAYVCGTLTDQQRHNFESYYLITPERQEAVRAAYLTRVYREKIAMHPEPDSPSKWTHLQVERIEDRTSPSPQFSFRAHSGRRKRDYLRPLSRFELEQLRVEVLERVGDKCRRGEPENSIIDYIRKTGIAFELTDEQRAILASAGISQNIISQLENPKRS